MNQFQQLWSTSLMCYLLAHIISLCKTRTSLNIAYHWNSWQNKIWTRGVYWCFCDNSIWKPLCSGDEQVPSVNEMMKVLVWMRWWMSQCEWDDENLLLANIIILQRNEEVPNNAIHPLQYILRHYSISLNIIHNKLENINSIEAKLQSPYIQ
jgi:hypothetical protein